MRLFENLILVVLLFCVAWGLMPEKRRPRLAIYLPAAALALIVVHGLVEGLRWQMIPAYVLTLVLAGISLRHLLGSARPEIKRKPLVQLLRVFGGLLLLIFVSQLPALFPVFTLPDPGGTYAVGTLSLNFEDPNRQETFTADPNDIREVPVQVWYPAEKTTDQKPVNYWLGHNQMGRILAQELKLPFFLLDHISLVKTHSYENAPIAGAQSSYPVLIFSHGYRLGYLQQNFSIMETLASHGYIVVSVVHPYEALAAPLANGQLARYASQFEQEFYDSDTFQETSLSIWSADVEFVLNELEQISKDQTLPQLSGRMDFSRLGMFGMSFGGSTISQVCLTDSRCKAGLTLDSPQYAQVRSSSLKQPFLFMVSDTSQYLEQAVFDGASGPAFQVIVKGAIHHDFSDLSLVSPLGSLLGFNGKIDGQEIVRIMNAYPLAFFDRYLNNQPGTLLNGISAEYPEVNIESRNLPK